MQDIKEPTC